MLLAVQGTDDLYQRFLRFPRCYSEHYNYYQVDCKLSDLTQNGYYYIDDKIYRKDAPEGLTNYNLVVFNNGFVIQLLHDWHHCYFIRDCWGEWSEWRQISLS